jgi:hypothetical protein
LAAASAALTTACIGGRPPDPARDDPEQRDQEGRHDQVNQQPGEHGTGDEACLRDGAQSEHQAADCLQLEPIGFLLRICA